MDSPGPDAPNEAITFCATLIDQWVRLGVRHAVVSPGSRSTPLALACAGHPGLRTHVHHDERSASFMALGIGLSTRVPALLVTTSGTATTELHSAVVEAHQACVPVLVCTADRPPELQGVHAPQTIRQTGLYGDAVRWFVEPGPPDVEHRQSWRFLAIDAFAAAMGASLGHPPGPVHLNLAFREPLVGPLGELPAPVEVEVPAPVLWGLLDEQLGALRRGVAGRRGVIVAGDRAARSADDAEALIALAATLGWPVLADHQSGLRGLHREVVTTFDSLLRVDAVAQEMRPEFVLHVGGLLASRITNEWLARSAATHVALDRWGIHPDPDRMLDERFTADVALACRQLAGGGIEGAAPEWAERWSHLEYEARRAVIRTRAGEPLLVNTALRSVPEGGNLVVSSSMPVRDLEWYGDRRGDIGVFSNRGANGIDGVTSTAAGVALGTGAPTICVIGDVAFLHDTNGLLGIGRRELPLCIVVIDNDGGGIFSFLPQAEALEPERFEQLFGTPHAVDLMGLARAHGLDTAFAFTHDEFVAILQKWAGLPRPLVVVMRSERGRNVVEHRAINDAVAEAVTGGAPTDG
ncbi:MAG: 2-succinyl-5-enolpyruvyl-6-hydroxy-3-cyclohexene-1-carboxylic-acid synthase [Acidimicrobiales bacterium]